MDALGDDPNSSLDGGMSDGLLCLRLAKGPPRPIPVIALAQNQERRALATELGADHVLPSPAPFADLQQTVLRLLGKPSSIK
jgi:CheY-like chemotaxis protein